MELRANKKNKGTLFLAGLMGLFALAALNHATTGVFLTSYIEDYGLAGASQGLCGTAESIGFLISLAVSALLLHRLQKTKVIRLMSFFLSIVLIGIGLHPSRFLMICFWYALFGISYGIIDSLSSSLISDLYPADSAKVMSYLRAVYCFGGMLSPLILNGLLIREIPWYRVSLLAGAMSVCVFLYYYLVASRCVPEHNGEEKADDRITWERIRRFFAQKGSKPALLFGLLYYGHQIGLTIWLVRYISVYLGEPKWGGASLTLYWIGAFCARVILPSFIRNHKTAMIYGNAVSAAVFIIGIAAGNGRFMSILALIIGFSEGTTIPMLVDFVCSLDRSNSTVACSIIVFTNNFGSLFIPSLIGSLISAAGVTAGIFILPALSLACAAIAAAVIFR